MLIVSTVAIAAWLGGSWATEQTERNQLASLCRKYSSIRVINPNSGKITAERIISCVKNTHSSRCEEPSAIVAKYVNSNEISKVMPSSFYVDPYKNNLQVGVNQELYMMKNGMIISILNFSSRAPGIKSFLWKFFLSDSAPITCWNLEI
jgi:hypothetical protein